MPEGGIYHDTIGRCNLYSNPYDTRLQSHPVLIKRRAENYVESKDVLETSQVNLEREIFLKLTTSKFNLSAGRLVALAQIGKYAFLVIMLPAYILCYGLPKWLLTEGVLQIFHFTKRVGQRLKDRGFAVAHKFVAAMQSLGKAITSPILNFIQTRIEHTREMFANFKQKFLNAYHRMTYPARVFHQSVIKPIHQALTRGVSAIRAIYHKVEQIQERLKELIGRLRHTLIYLPDRIDKKISELLQKVKEGMQTIQRNLLQPFQSLKPIFAKIMETYQNLIEKGQRIKGKVLHHGFYRPYNAVKNVVQSAREKVAKVTEPITRWSSEKIDDIRRSLEKGKEWVEHVKEKMREKAKDTWKTITDSVDRTLKAAAKAATAVAQEIVQVLPQPVISFFTPIVLAVSAVVGIPGKFNRSRRGVTKKIKKLKEKIRKGYRKLSRLVVRALTLLGQGYRWLQPKIKAVPKKTIAILKKILINTISAIRATFFLLRLMLAWLRVLFRFGMHSVRELAGRILDLKFHLKA